MTNDSTAVDFGINLLESEIDDVIFRTNEFLTSETLIGSQGPFWWLLVDPPNVYGIGGTVLYHRGGKHGLQDDGEERTVGRDETVQALGGEHHPLLVVPTC